MGKITFKGELDFLERSHKMRDVVYKNIDAALSMDTNPHLEKVDGFKLISFIQFSKLESWSVPKKQSETLKALSKKIYHMIFDIGCPNSVRPMLEKIATGRIKTLTQPVSKGYHTLYPKGHSELNGQHIGRGHFRWDYKAYMLNSYELESVRKLIKNL